MQPRLHVVFLLAIAITAPAQVVSPGAAIVLHPGGSVRLEHPNEFLGYARLVDCVGGVLTAKAEVVGDHLVPTYFCDEDTREFREMVQSHGLTPPPGAPSSCFDETQLIEVTGCIMQATEGLLRDLKNSHDCITQRAVDNFGVAILGQHVDIDPECRLKQTSAAPKKKIVPKKKPPAADPPRAPAPVVP